MTKNDVFSNLCSYDKRNPDCVLDPDDEIPNNLGHCFCDNCFYGRNVLALKLLSVLDELSELRLTIVEL